MTRLNLKKKLCEKKTTKVSKISCYFFWGFTAVAAVLIPVCLFNSFLKKSSSFCSPLPPAPCLLGSW